MKVLTFLVCAALVAGCSKQSATNAGAPGVVAQEAVAPAAPKAATPEEWKAALLDTYVESQVKDKGEGVTEFMAKFKLPKDGPNSLAFGTRDAFRKLRFYVTGMPVHISTGIQTYISLPDNGRPKLFLQPYYWGRGWIFMEKVSVLVDGELVFERECHKPDRDTQGVGVREQCDILLEESEINALRKVTNTSKVAVRMTGSKGYASVKKDGYDALKEFVKDLQSAIAIFDLMDAAVKAKLPPSTKA